MRFFFNGDFFFFVRSVVKLYQIHLLVSKILFNWHKLSKPEFALTVLCNLCYISTILIHLYDFLLDFFFWESAWNQKVQNQVIFVIYEGVHFQNCLDQMHLLVVPTLFPYIHTVTYIYIWLTKYSTITYITCASYELKVNMGIRLILKAIPINCKACKNFNGANTCTPNTVSTFHGFLIESYYLNPSIPLFILKYIYIYI